MQTVLCLFVDYVDLNHCTDLEVWPRDSMLQTWDTFIPEKTWVLFTRVLQQTFVVQFTRSLNPTVSEGFVENRSKRRPSRFLYGLLIYVTYGAWHSSERRKPLDAVQLAELHNDSQTALLQHNLQHTIG
ncbi:jg7251 [Pararge aegeria aegeria]|uniref:Jg7251 protein n=1 Tax=Pararge aegeria aegeria TaxID=348720 RepID=A0A8S4SAG0_9NEOP|nr:jg7251 [Pararge aegeria aegeria]